MPFSSSLREVISTNNVSTSRLTRLYNTHNEPYFFSIPNNIETSKYIESVLQLPNSLFIEISKRDDPEQLSKYIRINPPDIMLSVTTSSCYTGNLAHSLTDTIAERFSLNNNDKKLQITTCLHEAIMNAMLHGNLRVKSNFHTLNGLYTYQTEIKQRITIDIYKLRRVYIRVWNRNNHLKIAVSDEGNGFTIPRGIVPNTLPNGRGLMLIHALSNNMWIGQDQRTLFMTFTHN